ncbi:mitochondrial distribution and morphology 34 [Trichoderma cornu-damae]|uniref:Mitochondrial distribution and morphology protein 34 n=1 Tax=Trichoderma cornu-damae TaxID=654480 RepID=A0A9P8QSB1_9HYPO|nr:mitochondrial distribution and morphology 34 [Trichoderma cornu-damae]
MAFNFNWSPLTADADFYSRARDLLTKALNKSPKPPIIVDDILVSEFNLGTVPPDLEILEIGDLAEDRFRGIFKMCYSGDAYLTLKTRVQANPLNTYLSSKPGFTSPQPLAAASGLTIPLSITLSDIKLSAFIILVFSKQKGLTLVFRNDPLESLKVSSTFDSIQFVRDYLQRTIEQQLRNLMMDELPAIIHRLSLQLWCPDQASKGVETPREETDEEGVNPLSSPPLDPVDANGNVLDPSAISEISLNGGGEMQSLFSQKNLLRLAALTDSHHTLSLFTPGIRDVVFRAWSGCADRTDVATPSVSSPNRVRTNSHSGGTGTTYTFSDTGSTLHGSISSRPSFVSVNASAGLGLGVGVRSRPGRKKKNRVVNLRKTKSEAATPDNQSDAGADTPTTLVDVPLSEPLADKSIPEEEERQDDPFAGDAFNPQTLMSDIGENSLTLEELTSALKDLKMLADATANSRRPTPEKGSPRQTPSAKGQPSPDLLDQDWVMRMASEIARRVYDEKRSQQRGKWDESEDAPPPAYEASPQSPCH